MSKNEARRQVDAREITVSEYFDLMDEINAQGIWVPACGGTETPFRTKSGKTLLYCFQPSSGKHAYLDVHTDIFLTDDEACRELA